MLTLLNNLTVFLCKVGLVKSKLTGITNKGLRQVLRALASGPVETILLKVNIATIVRSSSTAAIVIINFMGSKVVGLSRIIKVVVNTGVNAAMAS